MIRHDTHIQVVQASKPQLRSHDSVRSSSASHEFSSDYASDLSSAVSRAGYETPLSRISTPVNLPNNEPNLILPNRPMAVVPAPQLLRQGETQAPAQSLPSLDNMSPPTPGHDDTPYIRFALEQITFDEEIVGPRRSSTLDSNFGVPRTIPAEDLARGNQSAPQSANPSNRPPQPFRFPSSSFDRNRERSQEQTLVSSDPPGEDWAVLGHVPRPLQLPMLLLLTFLCLLMIAGIIFSNIYGLRHSGLYDYDGDATPRYFVFEYLPQLLGAVILLWLHVVQAAVYRVLPYFCMSAELSHDRILQDMPVLSANFLLPDYRFFILGEPVVGIVLLVFWLMNFTLPFLSCLYQTQFYVELSRFRWTTVQGLGWVLVAWYFMLIGALLYCVIRFRKRNSALLWDPRSIADTIMLFQHSNILVDYKRSEVEPDLNALIPPRILRLGFWTPSGSHDTFHTVGQHRAPLNRLSMLKDQPTQQPTTHYRSESSDSFDIERHRYSNSSEFTRNIHSPFQRYRWCPWFLQDSWLLAWIIAAALLLIAFLVVSFVNRAVQDGFDPLLPSTTRSDGFSPSNFLYSFLPALLAMWFFLFWQPIEVYFRAVQPYANLSSPQGATAKTSLLQSYTAMPPVIVTVQALLNRDYKLAYITFVSLLSVSIPVLAGGVFTAQQFSSSGEVRMVASMPGYIVLCAFVSICALSFLVAWPTRKRYLPHSIETIAGQLSFLYASHLLNDSAIRNVRTKAELVSRLCGNGHKSADDMNEKVLTGDGRRRLRERRNFFADREPKFAFGILMGRDGIEHLGIDRLQRPGSGEMLVTTGTLKPSRSLRSNRRQTFGH